MRHLLQAAGLQASIAPWPHRSTARRTLTLCAAALGLLLSRREAGAQTSIVYEASAPAVVADGRVFQVRCRIDTPVRCIQGWSIGVAGDDCDIVSATTAGTVAASAPAGLRDPLPGSFEHTEITSGAGNAGAISVVVLSFTQPVELPVGTHDVLALEVLPHAGVESSQLRFADGLRRNGGIAVDNIATVCGESMRPQTVAATVAVEVAREPRFVRGDANGTGDVDISDAIFTLARLFASGEPFPCEDAADANDDGQVDISDAILGLAYLFLGRSAPPAPFPACGTDPTPDGIDCEIDAPCAAGGEGELLQITVDPDLDLSTLFDVAALRAEAAGRGHLLLNDGDILEGRVVAEGITLPDGADVFVREGTEIASYGDCYFGGALVPIEEVDPSRVPGDDEDAVGGGAGATSDDGYPFDCPGIATVVGRNGSNYATRGNPIEVSGSARFAGRFFRRDCDGRAFRHAPGPVVSNGTKSAEAIGGNGGRGRDMEIEIIGGTLFIDQPVCNEPGGNGADAVASGRDGVGVCDCGGDALARGGDGGRAGRLVITAPRIVWGAGSSLTVNSGGQGGSASASGGRGTDCNQCGRPPGAGGDASAFGGKAGGLGRDGLRGGIEIIANEMLNAAGNGLSPATLLTLRARIIPGKPGGTATAAGGNGGNAGGVCICGQHAADGGDAGRAVARGGEGGKGMLELAAERLRSGAVLLTTFGSNGGDGGDATATGGNGGNGGDNAASCPCNRSVDAGNGGNGERGGEARAVGGRGGDASGDNAPTSGNGGDAVATGGNGKNGGRGADCVGSQPLRCRPGAGGAPGRPGIADPQEGPPGNNLLLANPGSRGRRIGHPGAQGIPGARGRAMCDPRPPDAGACIDPLVREVETASLDPIVRDELLGILGAAREAALGDIEEAIALLELFIRRLQELAEQGLLTEGAAEAFIEPALSCIGAIRGAGGEGGEGE